MKIPTLGRKTVSGKTYAIVTLRDEVTKKRRVFHLGEHGSAESLAAYERTVAEWLDRGRRLPGFNAKRSPTDRGPTVAELLAAFVDQELPRFKYSEANKYSTLIRLVRPLYGLDAIGDFGPIKARALRQAMIERDWSRAYVNEQMNRIRSIWRWGVSVEIVPETNWRALTSIPALRAGQSIAGELRKIEPVPWSRVEQTLPFLSPVFADVARLQYLTGARPGEIVNLRTRDLDLETIDGIWIAQLEQHKNRHRGKDRTLYFGPKAQAILRPYLSTDQDRPIFAAGETTRSTKRGPEALRRTSYRRAVERACRAAFPPPVHLRKISVPAGGRKSERLETDQEQRERLGPEQWDELLAWRRRNHWAPNQLRHTAATEIRADEGLEAAQLTLGHASAAITDAVYAERNQAIAVSVARRRG